MNETHSHGPRRAVPRKCLSQSTAGLREWMSASMGRHPGENWKHSVIQMFGITWLKPQMTD